MPGYNYYIVDGDYIQGATRYILESPYAFADKNFHNITGNNKFGNKIHLCEATANFRIWKEAFGTPQGRFAVTQGGVFKLTAPFKPTVYFAMPYGKPFWFDVGPDIIVN